MKKIEVEFLVWTNNIDAFEMEDLLDFTGLSAEDILNLHNVNYKWFRMLFDENKPFIDCVKETIFSIYNENKDYKFLECGIQYVNA